MTPYSIKLTIEGLEGFFAEKYSYTVEDAHHMHRLLEQLGARSPKGPVQLCAAGNKLRAFDPMALLSRIMQYMAKVATRQKGRRFFTGARFEATEGDTVSAWTPSVEAKDSKGSLRVQAWGTTATAQRLLGDTQDIDGEAEVISLTKLETPVVTVKNGTIVCQYGRFEDLFKVPLSRLIEMCEEAVAKNEYLLATEIPHTLGLDQASFVQCI